MNRHGPAHIPAARAFQADERGTTTILALFLVLISAVLSGLAIDFSNSMARQTRMKAATESVAHAALYQRNLGTNTPSHAIGEAIQIAAGVLPVSANGEAIRAGDIEFGIWDAATETFTADSISRDAVRVTAWRNTLRDNAVSTFLLRIIGFGSFDLVRHTVYETYIPICFREGFVAEDIIDVRTGNTYESYFCLHSNTGVEVNTGNVFKENSIVSMPDLGNLVLPSDGFTSNTGLQEALREAGYEIRILSRLDEISAGVSDPYSPHYRDYITSSVPVVLDPKTKLDATVLQPGRVHEITCTSSSQTARVPSGTVLGKVVLKTNCNVFLGDNVGLEDAVIITTSTGSKSISGASDIRLGRDDGCSPGGDAQLVTYGTVDFPQYMSMFGSQIVAGGDVYFTADADGVEGASIVAGGKISGTTDMVMGFCNNAGMENNFQARYFRIAQSEANAEIVSTH